MTKELPYPEIVILTGAGISKESGIDTFRDEGGIWSKYDIEDVCTPEALASHPEFVNQFYNDRRAQLQSEEVRANAAHTSIANLQKQYPGKVIIVTQNIDNLHEEGGAHSVLHMHGELLKAECQACGHIGDQFAAIEPETLCPACGKAKTLRPHVVFFGEMPLYMGEIMAYLSSCDLFVAIGTSCSVYPAAGFVDVARDAGAETLELNLEPTEGANAFEYHRYGPATEIVADFTDKILAGEALSS
mgnify:CR=1 FL=1